MTARTLNPQIALAEPLSEADLQAYRDSLRNTESPIFGMTWEQYREYQSWRIMLQMIAIYFASYQRSVGGEKKLWYTKLEEIVTRTNQQCTKFPSQGLPENLIQPVALDFTLSNTQTEYWLPRMVEQLSNECTILVVANAPPLVLKELGTA